MKTKLLDAVLFCTSRRQPICSGSQSRKCYSMMMPCESQGWPDVPQHCQGIRDVAKNRGWLDHARAIGRVDSRRYEMMIYQNQERFQENFFSDDVMCFVILLDCTYQLTYLRPDHLLARRIPSCATQSMKRFLFLSLNKSLLSHSMESQNPDRRSSIERNLESFSSQKSKLLVSVSSIQNPRLSKHCRGMFARAIQRRNCSRGNILAKRLPTIVTFLAFVSASSSFRGFTTQTSLSPSSRMQSSSSVLQSATDTPSTNAMGTTWLEDTENRQKALERCIVPLSVSSYKGSTGRVGVLGGSERYTGAPYYAAMASLKCGADLAFCFCAEEAAIPLKSYSPELMVAPVYKASEFEEADEKQGDEAFDDDSNVLVERMVEQVCSMMDKMHVLVLGPGLGRSPLVLEATARIIQRAQSQHQLPLVIDADALFLLTLPKYKTLLSDESLVVLTPNAMELKRLRDSNPYLPDRCIMIEKGSVDTIRLASDSSQSPSMVCGETGGLKRSGGIGDVLAGTCGTLVAWNNILSSRGKASIDDVPLACWTACCFVKRATKKAFDIHRRSMTAPDILEELGPTIDKMTFDTSSTM